MTTTSPGWYDDGHGAIRWWDGTKWTDHTEFSADRPAGQSKQHLREDAGAQGSAAFPSPSSQTRPGEISLALSDGAVNASPKSRTSRTWIIWVVLGVVLVSAMAALAVLTPPLIAAFTTGRSAPIVPSVERTMPSTEDSNGEVTHPLSPAEEQAAIETVADHDWAWLVGDCDGYLETTTERFRTDIMEVADCDEFAAEVRLRADADPYVATVTKVEAIGPAIGVFTIESYVTRLDGIGDGQDEPVTYVYVVVNEEGWRIDDFFEEQ